MTTSHLHKKAARTQPMAGCIAAALVLLGYGHADASTTRVVANCTDSDSGSLRDVIDNVAASGDIVDLSGLKCSTISLSTGAIDFTQDSLTLIGPGRDKLAIDGVLQPGHDLILHRGHGLLEVDDLTFRNGSFDSSIVSTGYSGGACIYSAGDLTVKRSLVANCVTNGGSNFIAAGGGAFAKGHLLFDTSIASGNRLIGGVGNGYVEGGGICGFQQLTVTHSVLSQNYTTGGGGGDSSFNGATFAYSSVSGNSAHFGGGGIYSYGLVAIGSSIAGNSSDPHSGAGGGILSAGRVIISGSTISGNLAANAGGIDVRLATATLSVSNSTISGNVATRLLELQQGAGGLFAAGPVNIFNSTIAYNVPGSLYTNHYLEMESSIVVDGVLATPSVAVVGSHNLIISGNLVLPPGTITACPHLGPLADNGGPTLTHALLRDSPAIDQGANFLDYATDQRGNGFPRPFGTAVDIGAFEWQGGADDAVFRSGFDNAISGCK